MTVDMKQDEVIQVIRESGLKEDHIDLTNIDDSLLLDVVDLKSANFRYVQKKF